jgi:hypothetical protein
VRIVQTANQAISDAQFQVRIQIYKSQVSIEKPKAKDEEAEDDPKYRKKLGKLRALQMKEFVQKRLNAGTISKHEFEQKVKSINEDMTRFQYMDVYQRTRVQIGMVEDQLL